MALQRTLRHVLDRHELRRRSTCLVWFNVELEEIGELSCKGRRETKIEVNLPGLRISPRSLYFALGNGFFLA
jgi:hypothetical protein